MKQIVIDKIEFSYVDISCKDSYTIPELLLNTCIIHYSIKGERNELKGIYEDNKNAKDIKIFFDQFLTKQIETLVKEE